MLPSMSGLRPRCLLTRVCVSTTAKPRHVTTTRGTGIHTITTAAIAARTKHTPLRSTLVQPFQRSGDIPHLQQASSHAASTSTMPSPAAARVPWKGQRSIPALFVRSGTSNGLVLRASDLPSPSPADWAAVLPAAMGSPDRVHGRQLDGVGGGVSSTSKVCVLAPSRRADADVDFTFVQVGIRDGRLDVAGNCGNMSAVVGPVAWDWGFVPEGERAGRVRSVSPTGAGEGEGGEGEGEYREAVVRVFNTNTSKIMHARFRVAGDPPVYCAAGAYEMDGVPGGQSRIALRFADPAGAKTGRGALPTGNPVDVLALPSGGAVRASLVDVANPGVFVEAAGLGLGGPDELTPAAVEADAALKARLEAIRRAGAERMGLDPEVQSVPKIVLLFPRDDGDGVDVRCLAMSMGQAHKAVPLTLALCLGAAANIEGTVAAQVRRRKGSDGDGSSSSVVIGHPSGTVEVDATFEDGKIVSADLHRTARILMKGEVYY